ncbi:helix-turn-helix domain-containing protein [Jannaschia marina]|uniref:transcriptional repressor n=1 Tax=Jannaschia marina TaxID=2741674 RepID=UPI0015CB70F7|nr:transcriptional repressor [Jannaschia marina]
MNPVGFEKHDHADCIDTALAAIEEQCAKAGLQLTPIRKRVLSILLEQHRAMGAYEILDVLRAQGLKAQPPMAYRALDFLVRAGFAHRVERLNAFVACTAPGEAHAPVLLICRGCAAVAESRADTSAALGRAAADAGFAVERSVLEAEGLCPHCQDPAA